MTTKLTGAWRFRHKTTGLIFKRTLLVMQVEETRSWGPIYDDFHPMASSEGGSTTYWRDATVGDITSGVGAFPTGGGRVNG